MNASSRKSRNWLGANNDVYVCEGRWSGNFICIKAERGTVKYYQSTTHQENHSGTKLGK